jgi:hypothetical protein
VTSVSLGRPCAQATFVDPDSLPLVANDGKGLLERFAQGEPAAISTIRSASLSAITTAALWLPWLSPELSVGWTPVAPRNSRCALELVSRWLLDHRISDPLFCARATGQVILLCIPWSS